MIRNGLKFEQPTAFRVDAILNQGGHWRIVTLGDHLLDQYQVELDEDKGELTYRFKLSDAHYEGVLPEPLLRFLKP